MTVLMCHMATAKPPRKATTHTSPPLNWAHLNLPDKTPQKDKLEFPAQPQSSETQPELKVFLFPKAQLGSLCMWELWSVFPWSLLVPGSSALAEGADPGSHPIPARMACSAPCSLAFQVCQGALKWPHTGSRTSQIRAAPARGPLLLGSLFQHISPGRILFQAVAPGDCQRLFPIFITQRLFPIFLFPTESWFFH